MKSSKQIWLALSAVTSVMALVGCYAIPIGPDGQPAWYPPPPGVVTAPPPYYGAPPGPVMVPARLYPMNDLAMQTGVLSGTVTNMMTGKGQFQLNYKGETLSGEATRVSNDERRGVASAFGPSGVSMSCDYQMTGPSQGAGNCSFSNGARYQVHLGN